MSLEVMQSLYDQRPLASEIEKIKNYVEDKKNTEYILDSPEQFVYNYILEYSINIEFF